MTQEATPTEQKHLLGWSGGVPDGEMAKIGSLFNHDYKGGRTIFTENKSRKAEVMIHLFSSLLWR